MSRNETVRTPVAPNYRAEDYYYTIARSDEDGAFIARVGEFPSLAAHGSTQREALDEIMTVVTGALEDMEESGEPLPVPFSKRTYSGRLNVRMPEHLHRRLAMESERQGVSLNRWINTKLEQPVD
jgi:predicted HicB family RNase H-like nuclease